MSMSMTSPIIQMQSNHQANPSLDPIEYFNSWRTQSDMPCLIIKRISDIVEEYYLMKPQMQKKQHQMKTLFKYNERLLQTVEEFIVHQKKIVQRYNALCKLYITSFEKYCTSKNWDVNFNIKPIRSQFQKFSIKDWKFDIQQNQTFLVEKPYHQMLLEVVRKYFLNAKNDLERQLEKVVTRNSQMGNSIMQKNVQQIKQSIKDINNTTVTLDNMFDLLEKRKIVQYQIRQFEQDFDYGFFQKDVKFIDEITSIHSTLFQLHPQRLKQYIKNQSLIRRKIKKKSQKCRQQFQAHCQKIQSQNIQLKEEIQSQRKKREQIQKQKSHFKGLYQYMQLRSAGPPKKEKALNNTVIADDAPLRTTDNGASMRERQSKKSQSRINQLQSEIKLIRSELSERQKQLKLAKSDIQTNRQKFEELRNKMKLKLSDLGIIEEQQNAPVGTLLEKLFGMIIINQSQNFGKDKNNSSVRVQIKMTESVPFERQVDTSQNHFVDTSLHGRYTEKQKQSSELLSIAKNTMPVYAGKLQTDDKQHKPVQPNTKIIKQSNTVSIMQNLFNLAEKPSENQDEKKIIKRTNTSPMLPSIDLLSIAEKNSMQEESKNIESSKQIREPSVFQQKIESKNSVIYRQQQQIAKNISKLKQQNNNLNEQIKRLKRQVNILQVKLAQKQKLSPRSLISSLQGDLKNMKSCHAQQIQTLCQSIAKELIKLDGQQFQKMVLNVEQAIKIFKVSSNNYKKVQDNINQIPVLSKNLQQDNLFKSQNIGNLPSKVTKQDQLKNNRLRTSFMTQRQRSMKLALQSGQVKLLIKMQKSIYFGNKDQQMGEMVIPKIIIVSEQHQKNIGQIYPNDSDIKIQKQDDLIDNINNFEGMSRKKQKNYKENMSENSLRFSQTNIKNSGSLRQQQLKSSLKLTNPKMLQETQFLLRIQQKIQEIKSHSDNASDLYWFYKKYKQAIEALQRTQRLVRLHEQRKQTCMIKISQDDSLSRHKLEQNIYFLQQRVRQLEGQMSSQKQQYQHHMSRELKQIDKLKQQALQAMVNNFFNVYK